MLCTAPGRMLANGRILRLARTPQHTEPQRCQEFNHHWVGMVQGHQLLLEALTQDRMRRDLRCRALHRLHRFRASGARDRIVSARERIEWSIFGRKPCRTTMARSRALLAASKTARARAAATRKRSARPARSSRAMSLAMSGKASSSHLPAVRRRSASMREARISRSTRKQSDLALVAGQ